MTENPSSTTQVSDVSSAESFSAMSDHFMVSQMGRAALQSVTQTANPLLSSMGSVLGPSPLLLNPVLAGLGPQFPLAPQALAYLGSLVGSDGISRGSPTLGNWTGSTGNF